MHERERGLPTDAAAGIEAATAPTPDVDAPDRREVVVGATTALLAAAALPHRAVAALAQATAEGPARSAYQPAVSDAPWWPSPWGLGDQAGSSNWFTTDRLLEALRLPRTGKTVELGRAHRQAPVVTTGSMGPDSPIAVERGGSEVTGLGQVAIPSQLDGRAELRFYDGATVGQLGSPERLRRLGVEHVRPVITRGLLIDVAADKRRALRAGEEITIDDIERCLVAIGLSAADLRPGDALLFRTGRPAPSDRRGAGEGSPGSDELPGGQPGLGSSAAAWLAARRAGLIGIDGSSIDVTPHGDPSHPSPALATLVAKHGILVHTGLELEGLATEARRPFLLVALPLRLAGSGVAPTRPIAVM